LKKFFGNFKQQTESEKKICPNFEEFEIIRKFKSDKNGFKNWYMKKKE
jgi:hypothetical protein